MAFARECRAVSGDRLAKQGGGQINDWQFSRLAKPENGGGIMFEIGVAFFDIQAKAKRILERHWRDQNQSAGASGKLLEGLFVGLGEVVQLYEALE